MSYEIFQKGAALNSAFEIIPTKVKLLAEGVVTDTNGYMKYEDKTYITNMVKLTDLPKKLQYLFIEDHTKIEKHHQEIKETKTTKSNNNLDSLNKILFEQLQNIVDPEADIDMNQELKKASTVCNVADKIINIADLSLKFQKQYELRYDEI